MSSPNLAFGIPDIELACTSGTKINPSSFAGHELIALFCPLDAVAAAQEIEAYRTHSTEFARQDAWLLTFAENCDAFVADGEKRLLTVPDHDRHAWVAFLNLSRHPAAFDRSNGATFLFNRGGGLHRYWHGAGHVDEVLAELRSPSSGR